MSVGIIICSSIHSFDAWCRSLSLQVTHESSFSSPRQHLRIYPVPSARSKTVTDAEHARSRAQNVIVSIIATYIPHHHRDCAATPEGGQPDPPKLLSASTTKQKNAKVLLKTSLDLPNIFLTIATSINQSCCRCAAKPTQHHGHFIAKTTKALATTWQPAAGGSGVGTPYRENQHLFRTQPHTITSLGVFAQDKCPFTVSRISGFCRRENTTVGIRHVEISSLGRGPQRWQA